MKHMLIFFIVARVHGNNYASITKAIIKGLSRQLQGLWDIYLSNWVRNKILSTTKENIVINQSGLFEIKIKQNMVNTLMNTIATHFNALQLDKYHEQLINLCCPTLSHFKWYKYLLL
jgi:hypothetical protein